MENSKATLLNHRHLALVLKLNWTESQQGVSEPKYDVRSPTENIIRILFLNSCFSSVTHTVQKAMALSAAFLSEDQFSCSICLDLFNNPVSTPCGHSYCQACISSYWDTSKNGSSKSLSYQCPLCKETFGKRPQLHINHTLKEITEHFKRGATAPQTDRTEGNPRSLPRQQSLPHNPCEMPEGVINEMVKRFQRVSTDGTHQAHHNEPPPPYTSSPHR